MIFKVNIIICAYNGNKKGDSVRNMQLLKCAINAGCKSVTDFAKFIKENPNKCPDIANKINKVILPTLYTNSKKISKLHF